MSKTRAIRSVLLAAFLFLGAACTPHQAIDLIFPGADNSTAHRVASCESEYVVTAVSDTNDHGLFQINGPTWNKPWHSDPVAQWIGDHWHLRYDPVVNAIMAKKIRDSQGWDAWTCY